MLDAKGTIVATAASRAGISLVFRDMPSASTPVAAPAELLIRPRETDDALARRLALLALERGVEGFLRGAGPVERIVVQADPTLDDMLAATFLSRILAGETVPAGAKAFAVYAGLVREGLRPSKITPENSIEGIYLAVRHFAPVDLTAPQAAAPFLTDWDRMASHIVAAAEVKQDPFQTPLFAEGAEFARERAFLAEDQRVYRHDTLQGERWVVRIPGGPREASGLLLRRPRSLHWKHWSRSDAEAPLGGSYLFLAVFEEERHWRFSTDPVQRLPIAGLAEALQEAELARHPAAADDPWFDGKPFGYTMVAAPRRGTALTDRDVLRIVKNWTAARVIHGQVNTTRRSALRLYVRGAAAAAAVAAAVLVGAQLMKRQPTAQALAAMPVQAIANGKEVQRDLVAVHDPADAVVSSAELSVALQPGANEYVFQVRRSTTDRVRVWADVRSDKPLDVSDMTLQINNGDEQPASPAPDSASPEKAKALAAIFHSNEPNHIVVRVKNPEHETVPAKVQLNWQVDLTASRDLYLLAIGVTKYKRADLARIRFGAADAEAIVRTFKEQQNRPLHLWNVVIDPELKGGALVNEAATKKNILNCLKWLRENAQPGGLAVVTLSGHGLKAVENDRYFFITEDYDGGEPADRCMAWEDFAQYLRGMRCPVLVVLDTCHAGAVRLDGFRGESAADVPEAVDEAMHTFAQSKDGIVVLSACLPDQSALERSDWGHGALMLALLEGLSGRRIYTAQAATPLPHDRHGPVITLEDLRRYADDRVRELIVKRQSVILKATDGLYAGHIPMALRADSPPSK